MRSWTIAFSLGILLGGLIPELPAATYFPLLLIPAVLRLRFPHLHLFSAYCLGLFWLLHWAHHAAQEILPVDLEQKDFWVQGEIISLPEQRTFSTQFDFRVDKSCPEAELAGCDFAAGLLQEQIIQLSLYEMLEIHPAQRWQFRVRLKRPHGFQNPGGFDYEAWLWQRKIRASGYIRQDRDNRLLQGSNGYSVLSWREYFRQQLDMAAGMLDLRYLNLVGALTIGDRQALSAEQWQLFRTTGTTHLMVISGMHVGLVAWLIYRLAACLFARAGPLSLLIPAQRAAAVMAIIAAFGYAMLAGFALPAKRASIMITAFMLGFCLRRHHAGLNGYCLALTAVLMQSPLAPAGSGFWLSFGAVALLLQFIHTRPETSLLGVWQRSKLFLQAQCCLFIGLLPFLLLFFQQASLSAPLVNLLAIPFISLLVVPLCLLALLFSLVSTSIFMLLCQLLDNLLGLFILGLKSSVAGWPEALLTLPALRPWQWACLMLVTLLLLRVWTQRNKHGYVLLIVLILMPALKPLRGLPEPGGFRLDVLDVGQGLAVVLQTHGHVLLYDAGPAYSDDFNAGEAIVLPFLRSRNIRQIDRIILSHGDNDHAGGLPPILETFPRASLLVGERPDFDLAVQPRSCRRGQQWQWEGVRFELLHPGPAVYSGNNASCVLRVSNGHFSVLLTGDIENSVERRLLSSAAALDTDVLIAPHHGSATSSRPAFVEAVSPVYVVFSSGYLNQFGHPHPDVVKLYSNSGTIGLNTAETGAISWKFGRTGPIPEPLLYRQGNRRFWRLSE